MWAGKSKGNFSADSHALQDVEAEQLQVEMTADFMSLHTT